MKGESISHYRIIEKLGQGGMGEVFLAEDMNLNRRVAIKVVPEVSSDNAERLARFDREARLLASLNHPNIAAIYGLERTASGPALVMELVEGETLAQRIAKGPLPLEEALDVCRQIAEGLEAAHERGVIHRDLKPANLKVTPDGKVKILDFGLAKLFEEEQTAADATHSPTLTDQMTRPGVILGTAAYMAPEQAKGKAVDKRADIWAFGCIVYECLTGKGAFEGETITETLAAILKGEPEWQALPTATPWKIKDLLHWCLQKDPGERLHDIADARIEINRAIREPEWSEQGKSVSPAKTNWKLVIPLAAGCLAVAVVAFLIWSQMQKPRSGRIVRFPFVLPATQVFTSPGRQVVALSPDGSRLVYVANRQLFVRPMDSMEALPIRGTEGSAADPRAAARNPFFSPDGKWIGFFADGKLKKVSINGGPPAVICDCPTAPFGASWGNDDIIVFGQGPGGIWEVPAMGGTSKLLVAANSNNGEMLRGPQMLNGGKHILFTLRRESRWDDAQIVVQSLATGEKHIIVEGGTDARYVPTGHLAYVRESRLLVVPLDLSRLEKTGDPVLLVEEVMQSPGNMTGTAQFSFSADGTFVYIPAVDRGLPRRSLNWVDRHGKASRAIPDILPIQSLGLSPDGLKVALGILKKKGEADIWVYDLYGNSAPYPITRRGRNSDPIWTPDGKQIVFATGATGDTSPSLHRIVADGSTLKAELLLGDAISPYSFGLRGELLFLKTRQDDYYVLDPAQGNNPRPMFTEFGGNFAVVSPDGRFLAFVSGRTGKSEIWVAEYPDLKAPRRISFNGGMEPRWSPDQKELYYFERDKMMAVSVRLRPTFDNDPPRELFAGNLRPFIVPSYNVAPDGRFLMIREEDDSTAPIILQINVVLNWFEELKRLAPTSK